MFARRTLLKTVAMGSVAGLPLARILADPQLARAAAADLETISITDELGRQVNAALALPDQTPAGAVLQPIPITRSTKKERYIAEQLDVPIRGARMLIHKDAARDSDFFNQLMTFPNGEHDDYIDAVAGAVKGLNSDIIEFKNARNIQSSVRQSITQHKTKNPLSRPPKWKKAS